MRARDSCDASLTSGTLPWAGPGTAAWAAQRKDEPRDPWCPAAAGARVPAMRERGQSVVEWLAVLAGVATLSASLATQAPGLASGVTGAMRTMVCRVVGGGCTAAAATP